ncbi:hypothetical protein PanWU01x14_010370 [Parasponia andersonii]|uniref:Uncharacterized protein n=1 Tax=Parasponia andersonii TaxID=3476 RepID=A0A2P5E2M8_PARAD|nr:hypothetical protein PanWU01x14_010370 [Parasponia andersonii]
MGKWKDGFFHFNKINNLSKEEFDWKTLETLENLLTSGLFLKGASLPSCVNHPKRAPSPKKKQNQALKSNKCLRFRELLAQRSKKAKFLIQRSERHRNLLLLNKSNQLQHLKSLKWFMSSTIYPREYLSRFKRKSEGRCFKEKKSHLRELSSELTSSIVCKNYDPSQAFKQATGFFLLWGSQLSRQGRRATRQLPKKISLSMTFIDHFTSVKGWGRMKRRPPKITFSAAKRMLANAIEATVLMYDSIIECMVI